MVKKFKIIIEMSDDLYADLLSIGHLPIKTVSDSIKYGVLRFHSLELSKAHVLENELIVKNIEEE